MFFGGDKSVRKVCKPFKRKRCNRIPSFKRHGRSNPKFDKLLILAKYFDVPVEYFAEES